MKLLIHRHCAKEEAVRVARVAAVDEAERAERLHQQRLKGGGYSEGRESGRIAQQPLRSARSTARALTAHVASASPAAWTTGRPCRKAGRQASNEVSCGRNEWVVVHRQRGPGPNMALR